METFEKKYKEALGWMRQVYPFLTGANKEDAEHYFPELKDNEDEKIRKELVSFIQKEKEYMESKVKPENSPKLMFLMDALAYLERQKEQKPAGWNDTDMNEARNNLISVCRDWKFGKKTTLLPVVAVRARYFLEHLTEPKPAEWSEEDEGMLNCIIATLCEESHGGRETNDKMVTWLENRLKSLRPQPKQKWNKEDEEKIDDIIRIICTTRECSKIANIGEEKEDNSAFYNELVLFLKSLHPQLHWKPSGEQMAVLEIACKYEGVFTQGQLSTLLDLKEQLKKL